MEIRTGQVLEIVKKIYIVVGTEITFSKHKNNCYAHHFKTISKEDFLSKKQNLKNKTWTIKDISSMHGENEIRISNIKLMDKINLKKEVITKYLTN